MFVQSKFGKGPGKGTGSAMDTHGGEGLSQENERISQEVEKTSQHEIAANYASAVVKKVVSASKRNESFEVGS